MKPIDKRLARFGLSTNPFVPATPPDACHLNADAEHFLARSQRLVTQGGFALVSGDSGTGKTALLRCLHARVRQNEELVLGIISRPQASLSDFYRELGALFTVGLSPHNRWAGAKVLRERWVAHWETSHQRPVLFLDEAQDMSTKVLNELRLLVTAELDANAFLTVILAGDNRLTEKFQEHDLLPLASRIRVQYRTTPPTNEEIQIMLEKLLDQAGNRAAMTSGLQATCVEHACGNRRALINLGDELLEAALGDPDCASLDEHLFTRVVRPLQTAGSARRRRSA